ncbi:hypothetical protein F5Y08DRAFT_246765 [Xylaria arbuscula]|nr:hypothetical protein F5Y08DRAFT_246765 [Xylaria arbuscula]
MDGSAEATPMAASNQSVGSPALARDTSQTPGRDILQPQPTESALHGAHAKGIRVENGTRTSSPTTMSLPEKVQPPASQPPSAQPQSQPSTQPSQLPTRPLSEGAHTSQALPLPPYGYSIPPSSHQPHQHYQGFPSNTPPPLSTPSPSQFMQPLREPRDMNHMKNPKRFPSPDVDHEAQLSGFSRDVALVADAVQQACPEAVRRVVRDKWEKCVVGSEFHHAFLMNAAIHNASGVIMRRAIRDFGQHMVLGAKKEIASHLRPEDLDELAPIILEKCSDRFLDKALEQRLKTIDARSLINALARAERLGYEKGDILEGQPEGQPERVVPAAQMHSPGVTQVHLQTSSHPQFPAAGPGTNALAHPVQPLAHHAPPIADLKCKLCWREFRHSKHYEYHVQKQLCTRAASGQQSQFVCDACGAEFATKHGQQYHVERAVCGPHITAPATPKSEGPPSVTHHHFIPPIPPIPPSNSQPQPPQPPYPPQPLHPTLSQPISSPVGNPSPSSDDPYAHLTPEKRFQLDEELRLAEINFSPRFHEAMAIVDLKARQQKIDSLNNSFSTKQSMIRKKYGVRLRVRRTRQEIDEERSHRLGVKHGLSSPGTRPGTPSAKRHRSDNGPSGSGPPPYISRGPQTPVPVPQPINHLSVSQMNNSGLGGSTATAATTDPTASAAASQPPAPTAAAKESSPKNSLSSLQRKGYRVSSHVKPTAQTTSPSPTARNGSTSTPVVVDLSSDSDTDTDMDEIPATVPPKKSS